MAGKKPKTNGSGEGEATAASLLREAGKTLMPVLISAGSLLGFVAFAGGVILWTRFHAIGVPPEQAVDAVPDGELIATGSVLLLLFGFFGALALVSAFLVDRSARLTPGMAQFLLALFALEGAVAIILVEDHSFWPTVIDLLLFLPSVVGAAWVTVLGKFSRLEDDLRIRDREQLGPVPNRGFLRPDETEGCGGTEGYDETGGQHCRCNEIGQPGHETGRQGDAWEAWGKWVPLAIVAALVVAAVPLIAVPAQDEVFLSTLGGLSVLLAMAVAVLVYRDHRANRRAGERPEVEKADETRAEQEKEEAEDREKKAQKPARKKAKELGLQLPDRAIKPRMYRPRPQRFVLATEGEVAVAILLAIAVVLPTIRLQHTWLLVSLVAAAVVTVAVRRVAWLANERLMWFGIALFLSVPLFGTVMTMARNLDEPRVQPVAIIRSTDGPNEAIQGLYVTETDDRVYFANVATEGCSDNFKPDSSRLLWVPREDVVAMSIGPAQDVKSAGRTAQEMANQLTPGVETTTGENVTLRTAGEDAQPGEDGTADGEGIEADAHLKDPGPAVRPEFGRDLELNPTRAVSGQTVKLTRPFKEGEDGFGDEPENDDARTLRLNGMKLEVVKWTRGEIIFKVPENATSGEIRFECEALAGQPYLTVSQKPKARLSVAMVAGSQRVVFDSSRSRDPDGKEDKDGKRTVGLTRSWVIAGRRMGNRKTVKVDLRQRRKPYVAKLTVTDADDLSRTVIVRLFRLPKSFFEFDKDELSQGARKRLERVRPEVKWAVKDRAPASIDLYGHTDDVGSDKYNASLSLRRVQSVRPRLFGDRKEGKLIPMTISAFGESCPVDRRGGRSKRNRRVEIFLLDQGARVTTRKGCKATYVRRTSW